MKKRMNMFNKIAMITLTTAFLFSCTGNRLEKSENENGTTDTVDLPEAMSGEMFLLIGTYTSEEGSRGVYTYRFNTDTGSSDSISMVEADNPSYLALSPNEDFVYAVGEGKESGVYSFTFDKKSGSLIPINFQPTLSAGPCYITIDQTGKYIHTANYGGGSITSFQVNSDGSITAAQSVLTFNGSGPDTIRQQRSHLHSVMFSPEEAYLFATDLGSDKLYRLSSSSSPFEGQPNIKESSFKEFDLPPGTGPRHFAFHPSSDKHLYILGELSGEVLVYDYNSGDIELKQTIVADSVGARGSADIHISPDGQFLYASNRLKADGIAIFSIDSDNGTLSKIGFQHTARHPRNFVITPNGNYLLVASRDDNKIEVFERDKETGMLTDIKKDILVDSPVCLKFASMSTLKE